MLAGMYGYLRAEGGHGRSPLARHQCGLCHQLGAGYRTRARWLASDDPSVLAMLVEALAPDTTTRERVRCPIPGVRRRRALVADWLPALAAMQLFLAGEKLFDDRVDHDGWLSRTAERLLRKDVAEACEALVALGFPLAEVRAALRRQPAVEADPCADLDSLSGPTAEGLRLSVAWLVSHAGASTEATAGAGALADRLGRLLYLVDALDDLPRDLRRGRFNPLERAVGPLEPAALRFVAGALAGRVGALTRAFDALPLALHRDALRAIFVDGLAGRGWGAVERLPAPRGLLTRAIAEARR